MLKFFWIRVPLFFWWPFTVCLFLELTGIVWMWRHPPKCATLYMNELLVNVIDRACSLCSLVNNTINTAASTILRLCQVALLLMNAVLWTSIRGLIPTTQMQEKALLLKTDSCIVKEKCSRRASKLTTAVAFGKGIAFVKRHLLTYSEQFRAVTELLNNVSPVNFIITVSDIALLPSKTICLE